jgi:hypothetical protein
MSIHSEGITDTDLAPTDDEREAQGWREAALYDGDAQTQDDFMTGWRTADRLRRSEVPEPSAEAEFAPGECDGSGTCPAESHIHGCYTRHRADQCDAPEEYGHLPAEPQGEPSSEVTEPSAECSQCHRPDGQHKLGCGERFGAEPQGEPSDAQVLDRVEQFAQAKGVMFADGPRGAWLPVDALLDILGERAR